MSEPLLGAFLKLTGVPFLLNLKEEFHKLAGSVSMVECKTGGADGRCRDEATALYLKLGAMAAILVTGMLGVALPLFGKKLSILRSDKGLFLVAKALAAGVVLATAFVHILPDAMNVLQSDCLPEIPWKRFPFAGFISMLSAIGTLVVDLLGTGYFERKQKRSKQKKLQEAGDSSDDLESQRASAADLHHHLDQHHCSESKLDIVGMHAHAAAHTHSHGPSKHEQGKDFSSSESDLFGHSHHHAPDFTEISDDEFAHLRHVIVSQVLELGIITHSIIIGLSLGVSESPCTIRPLLGALSFHQFFEGFALGGCISQAGFRPLSVLVMSACFAMTTPVGIGIGIGISKVYNAKSVTALVVEGVLYSVSAGILVYMALVNLIAADFLSKRMLCDHRLRTLSLLALLLGASLMSMLAFWV